MKQAARLVPRVSYPARRRVRDRGVRGRLRAPPPLARRERPVREPQLAVWISAVDDRMRTSSRRCVVTRHLRPVLRAIALGSEASSPADLLSLYALPATSHGARRRRRARRLLLHARHRDSSRDERPVHAARAGPAHDDDVSAAALPLYIMLPHVRDARARAAPLGRAPGGAGDARPAARLRASARASSRPSRGPSRSWRWGRHSSCYAHARAFDVAERQGDAAELARGVLERRGRRSAGAPAAEEARARGMHVSLNRNPREVQPRVARPRTATRCSPSRSTPGTRSSVRDLAAQPRDGRVPVPRVPGMALAGILGARLGQSFADDLGSRRARCARPVSRRSSAARACSAIRASIGDRAPRRHRGAGRRLSRVRRCPGGSSSRAPPPSACAGSFSRRSATTSRGRSTRSSGSPSSCRSNPLTAGSSESLDHHRAARARAARCSSRRSSTRRASKRASSRWPRSSRWSATSS